MRTLLTTRRPRRRAARRVPPAREGWFTLRVAAAERAGDVRHITLVSGTGETLPSFTPGSHVVLETGERTNAYSLTGEFIDPPAYEISVLKLADGSGGSRWLHEALEVGDDVHVSPPRSAFAPVAAAKHHVLIAGGIGITPLLSHVRAARLYGRSFEVIYAHRSGSEPPLLDELMRLCGPDCLRVAAGREALATAVGECLADQPLGAVLFLCGPGAMMEAVQATATRLGWPAQRIHVERFSTDALDPGEPFTATLTRSGRQLTVESGVSLLEALEAIGMEVPFLCRQGVCGECRVTVTAGRPLHRDLFLSDEEKEACDSVMCCVSRAVGDRMELDL
ncbi:MAG: PDR/VanB family oxidoreductase [Solirubrobacteraceae bacterium]